MKTFSVTLTKDQIQQIQKGKSIVLQCTKAIEIVISKERKLKKDYKQNLDKFNNEN